MSAHWSCTQSIAFSFSHSALLSIMASKIKYMLAAYLDESYDSGNDGFYVVAGVLGDSWKILESEDRWRGLLRKHRLQKFKAVNMKRRPFLVPEFAAAIRDSGLFAFALIADQTAVRKHLGGSVLARQYQESPYMLLYQLSFVTIAMKLRQRNAGVCVSYVCDENARYLSILARSYPELQRINPQSAPYMGSCTVRTDDECIPLQMADLIASEIRKKAPTWGQGDTEFSDSLRLLLESGTLGRVGLLDDSTLVSIRQVVDARRL